jgi:UDP-glucuronate 4-epimerase
MKTKIIGIRFFSIFGEWGRPDMLILKYLLASKFKKPFEIFNYGNHYRDFTYIDDVINIFLIFLKRDIYVKNNIKVVEPFDTLTIQIS